MKTKVVTDVGLEPTASNSAGQPIPQKLTLCRLN